MIITTDKSIDSLQNVNMATVRDNINRAVGENAVAIVTWSAKGNIVLKTAKSTAKSLLEKKGQWLSALDGFPVKTIEEPEDWIKLVAHGIPAESDLTKFEAECTGFNDIRPIGQGRWLNPASEKPYKSVVFAVKTQVDKASCLRYGLFLFNRRSKVEVFRAWGPKTQCYRCQSFGHNPSACKKQVACWLCRKQHFTKSHYCKVCNETGKRCIHTAVRCVNCNESYEVNSTECYTVKTVRPNRPPPPPTLSIGSSIPLTEEPELPADEDEVMDGGFDELQDVNEQ